jgi:hypothetical protein
MSDFRAPKGWSFLMTNSLESFEQSTRDEKNKNRHKFENIVKNTSRKKYEDLFKETEDAFVEQSKKENAITEAYAEKKLKSKALIKEAQTIKAKRDNKKAKKETQTAETAV